MGNFAYRPPLCMNVDVQTDRYSSNRILDESEKAKIAAIEAAICPS
jgi:hypothetical protein